MLEQGERTTSSTRAGDLATTVEQAFAELLRAVEASTPEQWAAPCSDGEWTQGFAAYHAASHIEGVAKVVKEVAEGQPLPNLTMADLDAENAEAAKEHADCTVAETVDHIKASAPAAVAMVRALTDAQLDRKVQLPGGMPEVAVEMFVQMALVGHATYHLNTITGAR